MTFYQRMKDTRTDHDETQYDIAKALKITQPQYQLYESGKRSIPIDLLTIFCMHYKVSADYILGLPYDFSKPR